MLAISMKIMTIIEWFIKYVNTIKYHYSQAQS